MSEETLPSPEPEKLVLSAEQEAAVLEAFFGKGEKDAPSISELVKLAFPNAEKLDGRSLEGKLIQALLATKGLKAGTKTFYKPKDKIELDDEKKEYIKNNFSNATPVEIARILFNNPAISNLHFEVRSVCDYIKKITTDVNEVVEDIPDGTYRSPRTIEGVLRKVDKYVFKHNIKKEGLTAQHRTCLAALLNYMNTFRFFHQINLYEIETSRTLFESAFVRYTYDKADLTEEEVDQYIVLAHESVESGSIQRRKERLQISLEHIVGNGEEQARISVGLVDAMNALNGEYNQCVARQQKLLGDLKQKRSVRLEEQKSANASILNLVQLWKEEKTRKKLLHLAEARKKDIDKVVQELTTLEEVKSRILGLNPDMVING